MAPHGEAMSRSNFSKPPRLSSNALQRTISDISMELKELTITSDTTQGTLPPISEIEDARCECCGMCEEYTQEYIDQMRDKFLGKWICGLCAEAVEGEVEKHGGSKETALNAHMSACARFNKLGRAYPVLFQAEAMREMLKKSRMDGRGGFRAKSLSPRDKAAAPKKGGIARSSSCIPAITRSEDISNLKLQN
ncbi:uncharacterized protein LOC111464482 [Cucurbita moschata]|uniref:Uncharacterized protein LOC111464482 n=1 Tax=Cucurbita moschata TaxID=3662 RepID=A0A6J1HKX1_CUCMO|nr:uncharacterized protein LOC111464482 [Cucurbita moschata]